jgi:viologen exporter family transport system permease protein
VRAANATMGRLRSDSHPATIRMYAALVRAGFRRYATYRQAMVAAAITNSVFGFLRCSAILAAAAGAGGVAAGYTGQRLTTFVWVGQGLLGTVLLWNPLDLADRIRSGEVVSDLVRPINPVWGELAGELGRAGYGALTRFVLQVLVGALAFDMFAPTRLGTYPMFVVSVLLATLVSFGCRYLVAASAFWLLDSRGPQMFWSLLSLVLTGMVFPLWFLPHWAATALIFGTPLPSVIQLPLDILGERSGPSGQLAGLCLQAGWAVIMLAVCQLVRRRAERKMVIQGG